MKISVDTMVASASSYLTAQVCAANAWRQVAKLEYNSPITPQGVFVDPNFDLTDRKDPLIGGYGDCDFGAPGGLGRLRSEITEPPEISRAAEDVYARNFGDEYNIIREGVIFTWENRQMNGLVEYLGKGDSDLREIGRSEISLESFDDLVDSTEQWLGELRDPEKANFQNEYIMAGLTTCLSMRYETTGVIVPRESPKINKEIIQNIKVTQGGSGDSMADSSFGVVEGKKKDRSVLARSFLVEMEKILRVASSEFFLLCNGDASVSKASSYIENLVHYGAFDMLPMMYTVTFLKTEHMDKQDFGRKAPREIWLAAAAVVMLDKLLFHDQHKYAKLSKFRKEGHGVNFSGGGTKAFVDWMLDPLYADGMGRRITKMVRKVLKKDDWDDLYALTTAEESDVSRFDFSQFMKHFAQFYVANLNQWIIDPKRINADEFVIIGMTLISSFYNMMQIIGAKGEFKEAKMVYVFRMLASGKYNTAHEGSFNHSIVRNVVDSIQSKVNDILLEVCKDYPDKSKYRLLRLAIKATDRCQSITCSDDFLRTMPFICVYPLSFVNIHWIYGKHKLTLKDPKNAQNPKMETMRNLISVFGRIFPDVSWVEEKIRSKYPKFNDTWKICEGGAGTSLVDGMIHPSQYFGVDYRMKNLFYTFFSEVEEREDGSVFNITNHGCTYLKNMFVATPGNDFFPYRLPNHYLSKVFKPYSRICADEGDYCQYLSIMVYFTAGNKATYNKMRNCFEAMSKMGFESSEYIPIRGKFWVSMRKYMGKLNLLGVQVSEGRFPSYEEVMGHWMAPKGKINDQTKYSERETKRYYPMFMERDNEKEVLKVDNKMQAKMDRILWSHVERDGSGALGKDESVMEVDDWSALMNDVASGFDDLMKHDFKTVDDVVETTYLLE